jgi:hypothetical protein
MAVRSHYCAGCGIKLSPEQARFGQPGTDSLTTYCPSCAEEKNVRAVPPAPRAPASSSGRLRPIPGARPGAKSAPAPPRRAPRRAAPRHATLAIACAAAALAILVLLTFGADRSPPPPAMAEQLDASAGEAAPAPAVPVTAPAAPPPAAPAPIAAPAADPAPAARPPAPAALVGNARTKKVHLATCEFAGKISARNRVEMADLADAKRLGYEPCGACLP